MLVIRMQRTGRSGHAMFRMIVQESRWSPLSGRNVASLGNYDPHTKVAKLDTEKAANFLKDGAQPSDRAARLLKKEGVKLPKWVELESNRTSKTKNPEKLRKNRPAEEESTEEKPAEPEEKTDSGGSTEEPAPEGNTDKAAEAESVDKK